MKNNNYIYDSNLASLGAMEIMNRAENDLVKQFKKTKILNFILTFFNLECGMTLCGCIQVTLCSP